MKNFQTSIFLSLVATLSFTTTLFCMQHEKESKSNREQQSYAQTMLQKLRTIAPSSWHRMPWSSAPQQTQPIIPTPPQSTEEKISTNAAPVPAPEEKPSRELFTSSPDRTMWPPLYRISLSGPKRLQPLPLNSPQSSIASPSTTITAVPVPKEEPSLEQFAPSPEKTLSDFGINSKVGLLFMGFDGKYFVIDVYPETTWSKFIEELYLKAKTPQNQSVLLYQHGKLVDPNIESLAALIQNPRLEVIRFRNK